MDVSLKREVNLLGTFTDISIWIMLISYQLYSFLPTTTANLLKIIIPTISLIFVVIRNNYKIMINLTMVWLYIFIGYSFFSILITISIGETIGRLLAMLSLLLFITTLSQYVTQVVEIEKVMKYLITGSALYVIVFLLLNREFIGNIATFDFPMEINNLVTPSFYYLIWNLSNNKKDKKYLFVFILFTYITLISGIRKTIVFPIVFTILLTNQKYKGKTLNKIIYGILILILGLGIYYLVMNNNFMYEVIGFRFEGLFNFFTGEGEVDKSTNTRFGLIADAWGVFQKNPFFGVGLGAFREATDFGTYAHNNYMELLASVGIVGFLLFYWIHINLLLKTKLYNLANNHYGSLFFSIIITNLLHDVGTISYYRFSFIIPICLLDSYIRIRIKNYNERIQDNL